MDRWIFHVSSALNSNFLLCYVVTYIIILCIIIYIIYVRTCQKTVIKNVLTLMLTLAVIILGVGPVTNSWSTHVMHGVKLLIVPNFGKIIYKVNFIN